MIECGCPSAIQAFSGRHVACALEQPEFAATAVRAHELHDDLLTVRALMRSVGGCVGWRPRRDQDAGERAAGNQPGQKRERSRTQRSKCRSAGGREPAADMKKAPPERAGQVGVIMMRCAPEARTANWKRCPSQSDSSSWAPHKAGMVPSRGSASCGNGPDSRNAMALGEVPKKPRL